MLRFLRGGTRIYAGPDIRPRVLGRLDADEQEAAPRLPEETNRSDNFVTALLKLVPAEMVTLYLAFKDTWYAHELLWLWFYICFGTCIVLRGISSLPKKQGAIGSIFVLAANVTVATTAFVLWAFTLSPQPNLSWFSLPNWLSPSLVAIFTILAPIICPADNSAPGPH